MLITVTLNPALDKTARLDALRPRALNRLREVRRGFGGKGINVSRTVAALGGQSLACGFAAGQSGRALLAALEGEGIGHDFVPLPGEMRENLKLIEPGGALTELNEPGPAASPAEVEALAQKLEGHAGPGVLFVLAGSAGPGVPEGIYATLTARLKAKGARVLLDADGPLLAAALDAPVRADILKPNIHELAGYFGAPGPAAGLPQAALWARELRRGGAGTVCVSMGADGAAFFGKTGEWFAPALPVAVRSAVGAGDAMAAALALGAEQGLAEEQAFRLAVAAAAAACMLPGTAPPARAAVDALCPQVELRPIP